MGHKVNPRIFRMNITQESASRWFSQRGFRKYVIQDLVIRDFLRKKLRHAGLSRIDIERSGQKLRVMISTSKPGMVIGSGGRGIEEIRSTIRRKFLGSEKIDFSLEINEVSKPDLDATIVVGNIIDQIEKRIPFRRILKRTIDQVTQSGAQGVKITVAGRLNGAEIARTETLFEGKIPLHTLRSDIDYSRGAAHTIYGSVGVKVWIYKGELLPGSPRNDK